MTGRFGPAAALLTPSLLAAALLVSAPALAAAEPGAAGPEVPVIHPTPARITRYLETTGTVAAMQSVDLVARVAGTLQAIEAADGAVVEKGATLFVIEPLPYESKLRQTQAAEEQQRALGVQAEAEYNRQVQLRSSSAASQATLDNALASRNSTRAALQQAQEATRQAAVTYAYTRVTAPFAGVMTAHLVSVGQLVGLGSPTKLATLMQLDPVWVNATISEAAVLRARAAMAAKGKTIRDLGTVAGRCGTWRARPATRITARSTTWRRWSTPRPARSPCGVGSRTPATRCCPAISCSLRIPVATDAEVLLLPDDAITSDQGTPTVLVVGADGTVRQQPVRLGGSHDGMQIVDGGMTPADRIVASATTPIEPGAHVRVVEAAAARPAPSQR